MEVKEKESFRADDAEDKLEAMEREREYAEA